MDIQKIYIVEDEIGIRLLLTEVMKQLGYDVQSYEEVDQAIEAVQNAKPDVLFVDFMIGNVSGDQLLKSLQKQQIFIPTVVMSGRAASEIKQYFTDLQVDLFLEKPFSVEDVQHILKKISQKVIKA